MKRIIKIKDCTFDEFSKYCNDRACDGQWSMEDAITCADLHREVCKTRPIFGRKKARDKRFQEIKGEYLNLDTKIEIEVRERAGGNNYGKIRNC